MDSIIEVKNVSKRVGEVCILNNISFSIPKGKVTAFIGGSGSGKTTTIKSILDLFQIQSGEILIDGVNWKDYKVRQQIGYVPEKENFPKITALQFLKQIAYLYGINNKESIDSINEYAKTFDVGGILSEKLTSMSSGQKKRIMIIQALIHNPNILIMDEPTENLDPDNREEFYKTITTLKEKGVSVLISSHNLAEIEEYVDYAVIISSGEVKHEGEVEKGHGQLKLIYEKYKK